MSLIDSAEARRAVTPEQIKKEIEAEELSPDEQVAALDDPKLKEKYDFEFSYTDKRGRTWKGQFTNKILTNTEIARVATIRSRLLGGVPLDSIDAFTVDHTEMLSHCTVSLISRPKWAANLGDLYDPILLSELYKEVSAHEAMFHGRGQDTEAGTRGE